MDLAKIKVKYFFGFKTNILITFIQAKQEEDHQSYLEDHPELRVAIELFFESMCTEEFKKSQTSKVQNMFQFFTNPDLEDVVDDKLKCAK